MGAEVMLVARVARPRNVFFRGHGRETKAKQQILTAQLAHKNDF